MLSAEVLIRGEPQVAEVKFAEDAKRRISQKLITGLLDANVRHLVFTESGMFTLHRIYISMHCEP